MIKRAIIGVMCPGAPDVKTAAAAEEVGRGIARRGAILLCGGGGGAMEAASRGAKEAGGEVIGILPGNSAAAANPYVTIPIVTGMGHARNVINILTSQVVIAVGGSYGALSEIALALKNGRPVISLGSWRLNEIADPDPNYHIVTTPEEAVEKAFELL